MHTILKEIRNQLDLTINQLNDSIAHDEPFGNASGTWHFPGLTKSELIEDAQSIIHMVDNSEVEDLGAAEARIKDYVRRLQYLQGNTIPNISSSAQYAVPAYIFTIEGLRKVLSPVLLQDNRAENTALQRRLTTQLRGLETRIKGLEPRTATLDEMLERIENAHSAADQLPADLETLSEAQQQISSLVTAAAKDHTHLRSIRDQASELDTQLQKCAESAKSALEKCETAYSAATSVGLAAAFTERSDALARSMRWWVGGLVLALVAGSYFGSHNLQSLAALLNKPDPSASAVVLNFLLSLLSIGTPIWFAWLATKQVGQRFKLSEDYAFKASVSRAYEGFRREAARFDKEMEAHLLSSALNRLDELPLRLVETESHGSPWHEIASSASVRQALKAVPGFARQVQDMAEKAVNVTSISRKQSTPLPTQTAVNE